MLYTHYSECIFSVNLERGTRKKGNDILTYGKEQRKIKNRWLRKNFNHLSRTAEDFFKILNEAAKSNSNSLECSEILKVQTGL